MGVEKILSDAHWDTIKEDERRRDAFALLKKIKEVEKELEQNWDGMKPDEFERYIFKFL